MTYIILDLILTNVLKININIFLYKIKDLSINNIILSMLFIYVLTNNIYVTLINIAGYILYKITNKYYNNRVINLLIYSILYLALYRIDINYLINLIICILIDIREYNYIGDIYQNKNLYN